MRGEKNRQTNMFYAFDVEDRIRQDHPLRAIKKLVDEDLSHMGQLFNKAYSDTGRPSVPPERLLKAMLLQALYSIRSERQLNASTRTSCSAGSWTWTRPVTHSMQQPSRTTVRDWTLWVLPPHSLPERSNGQLRRISHRKITSALTAH